MLPQNAGLPDPAGNVPTTRRAAPSTGTPVVGRVGPPNYSTGSGGPREPIPGKPPGLSGAPDPSRLLAALKRRWLLALTLGLVLAGLAGAGAFTALTPKYTAYTTVRINSMKDTLFESKQDPRYEFNQYRASQVNQIKGKFVLGAALNREEVKRLSLEKKYGPDVRTWLETELKVESAMDSEIIRLTLMADDPDEAKTLVNAIAQAYMKEVVERDEALRAGNVAELDKVYTQSSNVLREKQNALKKQAAELETLDSDLIRQKYEAIARSLSEQRSKFNQVNFELSRMLARITVHKALEKSLPNFALTEEKINEVVESDPTLKLQIAQVQRYKDQIQEMKDTLIQPFREPRFATVTRGLGELEKKIDTRRAEIRKELEERGKQYAKNEYENKLRQLEAEAAPVEVQALALKKEVEALTLEMQKIGRSSTELEGLKGEIARHQKLVSEFGERLERRKLELNGKSRIAIFGDGTVLPLERKKQVMASAAGVMAALGFSALTVALWEFRRRRVYSTDEVSTGLGIRVVGAVPTSSMVDQLINATPENQDGDPLLTESIDAIRTQLLHATSGDPARILMVTSAECGEGKTTLASHLANSLSRAGRKTLLIDGDLRQPAVHQIFEVTLQPGFSEVLLGEVDTVDAILPTNVDGLMIMPAGQWDREVIQSLARGGVPGVLEKLKEEFDFIVIDSHPTLMSNDSLLIGKHVDAVILSVLREVSQTPKVYAAAQRLNSLGIRVLGAVVSGTDPEDVYATSSPSYSTVGV